MGREQSAAGNDDRHWRVFFRKGRGQFHNLRSPRAGFGPFPGANTKACCNCRIDPANSGLDGIGCDIWATILSVI